MLTVLFLNTLFGTLLMSPVWASSIADGSFGFGGNLAGHAFIAVKSLIVLSSWVMGYYAVNLLEQGIGNRVVGMKDGKVYDVDIQEALSMKKPFNERRYKICDEINF